MVVGCSSAVDGGSDDGLLDDCVGALVGSLCREEALVLQVVLSGMYCTGCITDRLLGLTCLKRTQQAMKGIAFVKK